jgi:hypothetical protein
MSWFIPFMLPMLIDLFHGLQATALIHIVGALLFDRFEWAKTVLLLCLICPRMVPIVRIYVALGWIWWHWWWLISHSFFWLLVVWSFPRILLRLWFLLVIGRISDLIIRNIFVGSIVLEWRILSKLLLLKFQALTFIKRILFVQLLWGNIRILRIWNNRLRIKVW